MQDQNRVPYDLGIDIGIASVGAALVADNHIIALHVRTFDKAEIAKTGEALNSKRREARLTRRRLKRRRSRLLRVRKLFFEQGLLSGWDINDRNHPLSENITGSPWTLRHEGLVRKLSPTEWAVVLYHLIKHRGFQSNRKSEITEETDDGKMVASANKNQQRVKEKGYKTIGEMIAIDPDFSGKKRNAKKNYSNTIMRQDIEDELHELFNVQRDKKNEYAGEDFEKKIHTLLMERRPALSGEDLLKMVGRCTFEPTEYRAPKSLVSSERFVWLSKLNNLRIRSLRGERILSQDERKTLDEVLHEKGMLKYSDIRRLLNLGKEDFFTGVRYSIPLFSVRRKPHAEENERNMKEKNPENKVFHENKYFSKLKNAYMNAKLEKLWSRDASDTKRLDAISQALTVFKEEDEIRTHLLGQGVEVEIVEAVLPLSFSGFGHLSIKALQKVLPHLENGSRYDEAVKLAGYSHHSVIKKGPRQKFIPPIDKEEIRNPVVLRSLNQARKLVNAIVRRYGSPRSIHIELARDLNKSFKERREIENENDSFRKLREDTFQRFIELFGQTPKKDELIKFRLYQEQDGKCAYCLEEIDLRRLLENKYVEIDHVLPYSRSFDDSISNKVLVHIKENQDKGNSTPFEFLGGEESERWNRYLAFVDNNKKYSHYKRLKLLRKDLNGEKTNEFLERNLSDTRFIARYFKNLVESSLLLDGEEQGNKRCIVVSGQMTAYLRKHWGLVKNREESDRHHAMDAAVVAVTSHSMIKRLSDWSAQRERRYFRGSTNAEGKPEFPKPYAYFVEELKARLEDDPRSALAKVTGFPGSLIKTANPIRVSRAPRRLGTGQAHEETIRSKKFISDGVTWKKVPLKELKMEMIEKIVGYGDPRNTALIEGLKKRLYDHGNDGKKAFAEPFYKPPGRPNSPIVNSVKIYFDLKSGIAVRGGIAERCPGSMIRIDIFTDGIKFYAVPLYISDIGKKDLPNRAVVASKDENEWEEITETYQFLFSLYPNDWIKVEKNGEVIEGYFKKFNRATGVINVACHDLSKKVGRDGVVRGIGVKTVDSISKFHVDLLGGLHLVRKEFRQPLRKES